MTQNGLFFHSLEISDKVVNNLSKKSWCKGPTFEEEEEEEEEKKEKSNSSNWFCWERKDVSWGLMTSRGVRGTGDEIFPSILYANK